MAQKAQKYFGFPVINAFRSHTPKGYYDSVKGHTGIDIATPMGTPIYFPIDLKVVKISKQKEMGLTLYLQDLEGKTLVLAHLESVEFEVGETVGKNKIVCHTGNSGEKTTGPHLHFEIISEYPETGNVVMQRSLNGFHGFNIDPGKYLEDINKGEVSDAVWVKTHLPEVSHDWVDVKAVGDPQLLTALRALAVRMKDWNSK